MENLDFELVINENKKIIKNIVKRFKTNLFDQEDLYQVGLIALYKALQNYKESYHVKFSTYAYKYILYAIFREYNKLTYLDKGHLSKIRKIINENKNLSINGLTKKFKLSRNDIMMALNYDDKIYYLEKEDIREVIDEQKNIGENYDFVLESNLDKKLIKLYLNNCTQKEMASILKVNQSTISRKLKKIKIKLEKIV